VRVEPRRPRRVTNGTKGFRELRARRAFRVSTYLDDLQAQVDELSAAEAATQAELEALLPSLLDRAFRGEL